MKSKCSNCKKEFNVHNLSLYRGERLCQVCKPNRIFYPKGLKIELS
jgi:DNA-directed RNA polymerase subunit RPC12/RpoP